MWESSFKVHGFRTLRTVDELLDRHFCCIQILPAIRNQSGALGKQLDVFIKVIGPHLHFLKDLTDFPQAVLQGEWFILLRGNLLFF